MKYYVYFMYNKKHDKFYIGQTYSLIKRINEHKTGKANYTSRYNGDWYFVYYETFNSRSESMQREKYYKSLKSKQYLKKIIKKRTAG